ncbi:MAG: 3-phosphoshikimate 1-carboxyvinyltransferase, partial [Bacteroidota bacterium]
MNVTIIPSSVSGNIRAPRSKSDMQRACAAALLHHGETRITDPGRSNDDKAALDVIAKLGATVEDLGHSILVKSSGVNPLHEMIHCGESGLGIRMFTPIAALSEKPLTISGTGSLVSRPMGFFDEIFPQLNISIKSQSGKLPLHIQGPLQPATIEVDGSLSSQFLTGLLMAYSASG